ncbi:SDR family NAD(P)-dependent oxidoreductase [Mycobacterium sp. URHB0044]|uniref:SDR family NAD(P)-dependent oxidoreductase n=1 Tax=Mycobacterium sp. URHB0044 TaxID=1380386 RepID=UPI0006890B99|nr:SDR family oxidoreductase [Mycobacterium sp. URHB0044]
MTDRMERSHDGRAALVTGAGRGLGRASARRLAAEGADTVLVGRGRDALEAVAAEIEAAGGQARVITADVSNDAHVEGLCAEAGPIDILVNNAAAEEQWSPITMADLDAWKTIFDVNVFAAVRLMKAFAPGMSERGYGVVVNMSSIGGSQPAPFLATYSASKAALDMVSRTAAMELAGSGVRVNSIASGITDMGKTFELLPAGLLADVGRIIPAARLGNEDDIASAVSYLCSDGASYVNGQILTVDGAMTSGQWATTTVMMASLSEP